MDLRGIGRRVALGCTVVLVAACGVDAGASTAPTAPTAPIASSASVVPQATSGADVPGGGVVRDTGAPFVDPAGGHDAGSLLPVRGAVLSSDERGDGFASYTVTASAGTLGWAAPPRGGRVELQTDGSVTLHDDVGTVVAALAAPVGDDGTRGAWRPQGDVLALESATGSASFVVGTTALGSATWGEADGGRSLLVIPADWVRGGSMAAQQALVSQLALAEPEAASASMQAQLWCHALGAPDKASWNIEPWRPEVGTSALLTTRCNPTDTDL